MVDADDVETGIVGSRRSSGKGDATAFPVLANGVCKELL